LDARNADKGFGADDMAFDSAGNLYVSDVTYTMVRRIAPDGTISNVAGHCNLATWYPDRPDGVPLVLCGFGGTPVDGVGSAANFVYPGQIGIDSKGNLVLADGLFLRRVVPGTGQVSTVAGYGLTGNVDGAPTTARFGSLNGIAVDENDNIYVADSRNNAIRKVAADGTVSTVFTMGQPRDLSEGYGQGAPRRLLYLGNKTFYVLTEASIVKVILP
jgi:hypothetical protein